MITGLVVIADWVVSDIQFIEHQQDHALAGLGKRFGYAQDRARERLLNLRLQARTY